MKKLLFVALFALSGMAHAVPITDPHDIDSNNSVGYTLFEVLSAGFFNIDARNTSGGNAYPNGQTDIDPQLYLFRDDGDLTSDDFIAENDDGGAGYNSRIRNRFLSVGRYLAAVSDFYLSTSEAVNGINNHVFPGRINVRITAGSRFLNNAGHFTPNARLTVPEPTSLALLGLGLVAAVGVRRRSRNSLKA